MRLLLLLIAAVLGGTAYGQTYPPVPQGTAVYDRANLISPQDEQSISSLSQDFMQSTGAPIIVATIPSLSSVGAGSIESYATGLFNTWRIGNNAKNGGILLLVSKADRKTRIELGRDWQHDYDGGARQINQNVILPAFKRGDFSGGIRQGVEALAHLADGSASTTAPPVSMVNPGQPIPGFIDNSSDSDGGMGGIGFLFLGVFIVIVLIA